MMIIFERDIEYELYTYVLEMVGTYIKYELGIQ